MKPPKATLGGVLLANAASVGWSEQIGVSASTQMFVVHDSQWSRLKDRQGFKHPLTLVIERPSGTETWKRLYITRETASTIPYHRQFAVADGRYWWGRVLVRRSFNMTRTSGTRTLIQTGPVELAQAVDDLSYKQPSLNDGKRHTARTVLDNILTRVSDASGHGFRVLPFPGAGASKGSLVQNLEVAENGASAVTRALQMIPGAEIRMDAEGDAVVFDATNTSVAAKNLEKAGKPTQAGQFPRWVNLKGIRPSVVRVYFERQLETRFDTVEESDNVTTPYRINEDPRMQMENVIPLPDVTTSIAGVGDAVPQGTYIPIRSVLAAWNKDVSSIPGNVPPLTLANVRRYWMFLEGFWGLLGNLTTGAATVNWANRMGALRQHYRQTYQIPRKWRDRMRDQRAYRVGILHPVSGTRAPAMAWSDYSIEPNLIKWAIIHKLDPEKQSTRLNVSDYPGFAGELVDKDASPAVVTIPEPDLGIIHIGYRTDPYGNLSRINPSRFKELGGGVEWAPSRNLEDQNLRAIADDGRTSNGAHPYLASDHRAAIVYTATPSGPNDESRLHYIDVNPDDLDGDIAQGVQASGGLGPVMEVYVPPSVITAWYGWDKTVPARESAKAVFGVDGVKGADEPPAGYAIVNGSDGHSAEGDSVLSQVARSMAASVWAEFKDANEGNVAVHMESVEVTGNIESVRYGLDPDGRLLARVSYGVRRKGVSPMGLLPPAAREVVLREVPQ